MGSYIHEDAPRRLLKRVGQYPAWEADGSLYANNCSPKANHQVRLTDAGFIHLAISTRQTWLGKPPLAPLSRADLVGGPYSYYYAHHVARADRAHEESTWRAPAGRSSWNMSGAHTKRT